jgi:hypothetical protein
MLGNLKYGTITYTMGQNTEIRDIPVYTEHLSTLLKSTVNG